MDLNVSPQYDVPLWNETRWNGCWNAEQGVGLYLHAGRYRPDLDMWWAQVVAYLPDEQLCVTRFFGRNPGDLGACFGGLDLTIGEDGWTATFDGVGELTTIDALARGLRGSGAPLRSLRFEVAAEGAAPVWDMYDGVGERMDFAGDMHVQQGYTTSGSLRVGEAEYPLDGIGFKDHSSGARDFTRWFGHRFLMIVTAEWTCHAVVMYSADGTPGEPVGAFFRGGERSRVTRFELPELADSAGGPIAGELLIETDNGERLEFDAELVHALPMTMTVDNDYLNGVGWRLGGDPIVLIEGNGALTAPDGSVAHCFHERSALRSAVRLPDAVSEREEIA